MTVCACEEGVGGVHLVPVEERMCRDTVQL